MQVFGEDCSQGYLDPIHTVSVNVDFSIWHYLHLLMSKIRKSIPHQSKEGGIPIIGENGESSSHRRRDDSFIAKVGSKFYPNESITEQLLTRVGQVFRINIADSKLRIVGD